MRHARLIAAIGALTLTSMVVGLVALAQNQEKPQPEKVQKLMSDGNWKEAYDGFAKLALDPDADPKQVGPYLQNALGCLQNLGRAADMDEFREKVIAAQSGNWRLLSTAAQTYMQHDHSGTMIAGKFVRGPHRGGTAKFVNSYERDRVRALQLMQQAIEKSANEPNKGDLGEFYIRFSEVLLGDRGYNEAWRLQYLSDLTTLPDYDEGGYGYYYGPSRGAPVNPDGTPVFYSLPKSWKDAKSDGERWRWTLMQATEMGNGYAKRMFADFLSNQFGAETLAQYGWFFGRAQDDDDTRKDESGAYALHTLAEDETIARLATGIKRFKLPEEFNFIRMYREMESWDALGQIFENRRQYDKAVECWQKVDKEDARNHIKQIQDNWCMFEPILTQPAGQGATVDFRFRNGKKVSFEAHEIDIPKLLGDVKKYIKSAPNQLDWQKLDVANIGYRLVEKDQKQYIGEKVASWDLELQPRPNHFDRRITVTTPLQKAGAYLLTARMEDGNTSLIVVWLADTVIVKKPLDKRHFYFVADAVTGAPIAKANLEFFGWRQEHIKDNNYRVTSKDFAEFTDADGQLILTQDRQPREYQYLITATTAEGRLAYLGFTNVWYGDYYDQQYNEVKPFTITDRPVYRPEQPVKFKFWINTAKYDQEGKSTFAGQSFTMRIDNPRGEKVFEKSATADDFGGMDGEFTLPKEAMLGVYQIYLLQGPTQRYGNGHFRVEEYKKPEFEVKVDAPAGPVMLGEKISATVQAKYYFGAPVVDAKVKYKVLRSEYSAHWYPVGLWDWMYGPGYWWFAYDYTWYPSWREWGCARPMPWWWWNWHRPQQPELLAEGEAAIGNDGTFKIDIDTAPAKAMFGDRDHKYEITAEVTDKSRRTIVGQGTVLVARKPFKVYAWVNRGHYRVGDVVQASFNAQTLDNKPVKGSGTLRLLKIAYDKDGKPVETEVQKWNLDTNDQGQAQQQIKAAEPGQYRLSYTVTDAAKHAIEGGYVFVIAGEGLDGSQFRFNDIELVPDKREYAPGQKVGLMINTNRVGGTVLLFVRPANGVYLAPQLLRLKGKSTTESIEVLKKDMPNFFIEAVTISGGKVYTDSREIVVPPEKRVLNVEVKPSAAQYKPGEKAKVTVKLTDPSGEPFAGTTVVAIYDKAVEYISGGSNVPDIKEFFWKWRRQHQPRTESSLDKGGGNLTQPGQKPMEFLGIFGQSVADEEGGEPAAWDGVAMGGADEMKQLAARSPVLSGRAAGSMPPPVAAPMRAANGNMAKDAEMPLAEMGVMAPAAPGQPGQPMVEPTVRTAFADTAYWAANLVTGKDGLAEVELTMPENLTTWKARVWAMGEGTRVGEGSAEMVTTKNLLVRLQAPRFFMQKDEVVLSANVHNYLKSKKSVKVVLELDGPCLQPMDGAPASAAATQASVTKTVEIDAGGEKRVDWRVKVLQPGQAVVRMKALSDEESDAMEMTFPVYVHGMLKMESFSGVIRPEKDSASITLNVPAERRPDESRLEVRYSPTLAGAMVDALPYMVDYPYGCTEQTLNRFLPTVITQKVLIRMGLDLKDIQAKRTNLNAQEIGKDAERAKDWKRTGRGWDIQKEKNPVFDQDEVNRMVKAGLDKLTAQQLSDGGWGWFSGFGEQSYPHTTALVVHGLQIARENDVALVPGVLERGIEWLKRYQAEQIQLIKNAKKKPKVEPYKEKADALDAFVYMVLVDEKADNREMRDFLYRDRTDLPVYAKSMFGIALHRLGQTQMRDMLIRNIEQYLAQDDENQTAYLRLPENNWWWCWYGSEYEAQAYYLKLLTVTQPRSETASRLVKYLVNNRKHATYWNSTRDTAICIEAFADYIKASGEDKPDMTVEILLDGKQAKQVKIDKSNLFSFDNKLVLEGPSVTTGQHKLEFRKKGTGPLYFNAYLTNFTLEDPITKAGLEIKVNRKYYKLVREDKTIKAEGARGQAVDQKVEKYQRQELADLALLKSGDLVEIELTIDSKNDYEYIVFEDMKAAGFEPVEVQSGYGRNEMGAYMELRDERVCFFVRSLARGQHSISYRMRAEIPGKFSALPTKASAMYAPELKANSDELKLRIED